MYYFYKILYYILRNKILFYCCQIFKIKFWNANHNQTTLLSTAVSFAAVEVDVS